MSKPNKTVSDSSRREFMATGLSVAGAGVVLPGLTGRLEALGSPDAELMSLGGRPSKILVVVELSGGNDGLGNLIPYEDDSYHRARPRLRIKKERVLKLDKQQGLHPGLRALLSLWEKGDLALVQGVGYPGANRSHFHSMDIWHSANPKLETIRSGWLGRALDLMKSDAPGAPGMAMTARMPVALYCEQAQLPTISSLASFAVRVDARSQADARLERRIIRQNLVDSRAAGKTAAERVRQSFSAAVAESDRLKNMTQVYRPDAQYPRGLGDRLRLIAQLIHAGHGSRVYYSATGGYDTHANQTNSHGRLHASFAGSVAAFFKDLEAKGHADSVVLLAYSEFGRRVHENASVGTDHGAAGISFLMGPSVIGGIHGGRPSLTDLDRGDLKFTVDFRRIYACILERWLGLKASQVISEPVPMLHLLGRRRSV